MILKYFGKGSCQVVLQGEERGFVYKFPLQRRYDSDAIQFTLSPREVYRYIRQQRKYQKNLQMFETSCQILKRLDGVAQNGLQEFFPATVVYSDHRSIHVIDGREHSYSGRAIKQELVQDFFDNKVPLRSFDWQNIVDVEIELWRYGVGLGAPAETWGPKNWGRVQDGIVKLVDTSHLTHKFQIVSSRISSEIMTFRKEKLLSYGNVHNPKDVEEYFRFMSTYLNMNNLQHNWGIYLHQNP